MKDFAAILFVAIPIVAIIASIWALTIKTRCKYKLNSEIVNSGIDKETAKLLLSSPNGKTTLSFSTLRIGLPFTFLGIGAIVGQWLGTDDFATVFSTIIGAGLGLILSFIIEWQFSKNKIEEPANDAVDAVE